MSEYVRALKFKKEHRTDDALGLLKDLLETQVLHEVRLRFYRYFLQTKNDRFMMRNKFVAGLQRK